MVRRTAGSKGCGTLMISAVDKPETDRKPSSILLSYHKIS